MPSRLRISGLISIASTSRLDPYNSCTSSPLSSTGIHQHVYLMWIKRRLEPLHTKWQKTWESWYSLLFIKVSLAFNTIILAKKITQLEHEATSDQIDIDIRLCVKIRETIFSLNIKQYWGHSIMHKKYYSFIALLTLSVISRPATSFSKTKEMTIDFVHNELIIKQNKVIFRVFNCLYGAD